MLRTCFAVIRTSMSSETRRIFGPRIGRDTLQIDFQMEGESGDHNEAGLLTTAMRLLNAIPAVCAAEPGLLSVLDMPLVTGKGLMR